MKKLLRKLLLASLEHEDFERIFFSTSDAPRSFFARYRARPALDRLVRWRFPGAARLVSRFNTADAAYVKLAG